MYAEIAIEDIPALLTCTNSAIPEYTDVITVIIFSPTYETKNFKTRKALMYLQAQFNFMLHDNFPKIEIEYVYPSEWRAGCGISTGRGIKRDSLKEKDIEFVKKTYGLSLNDDISDAICIGYFATHKRNDEEINWE